MKRSELLATLKLVAPALDKSPAPVVQVMSHLCFDGTHVFANDNKICLRAPCDLPIKGAVPGQALLAMLGVSHAKEVTCSLDKGNLVFKLGKARFKSHLLPVSDFVFKEPNLDDAPEVPLTAALHSAIKAAALVAPASEDDKHPGITAVFGKRELIFYATNERTLVRASVPGVCAALAGRSFILSLPFYDALLKMRVPNIVLRIGKSAIAAVGERLELFGSLRLDAKPDQFERVVKASNPSGMTTAQIPTALERCLERALVVCPTQNTEFTYEDGVLKVFASSKDVGELSDNVALDLGGTKPVMVNAGANHIKQFIPLADTIGFSNSRIALLGKGFIGLVAVSRRDKASD